jgi:hypothetical protein
VSEIIVTRNQILRIAKGLSPGDNWKVSKVAAGAFLKDALDAARGGDYSFLLVCKSPPACLSVHPVSRLEATSVSPTSYSTVSSVKIMKGMATAGDLYGAAYDKTDNVLLRGRELTEDDLKRMVAEKL